MKKSDREKVHKKYNGHCAYCGCELQKGWHVDHVEPCRREYKYVMHPETKDWVLKFTGYSNPDANHMDNYLPSCPSCNINKHGDTIEQFREAIAGYLRSLNLRMVQYKMAKKYGLVEETNKPVIFYFETINPTTMESEKVKKEEIYNCDGCGKKLFINQVVYSNNHGMDYCKNCHEAILEDEQND